MKYIPFILLTILLLSGCEKDKTILSPDNILEGKLKSFHSPRNQANYHFTYDSEGRLSRIDYIYNEPPDFNYDTLGHVKVAYVTDAKIELLYSEVGSSTWTWQVGLQGNKVISLKSSTSNEYTFLFKNGVINEISVQDMLPVRIIRDYDIVFDGSNYVQYHSYLRLWEFPWPPYEACCSVNNFTFSSIENDNLIPFQETAFTRDYRVLDPIYVLGVAGYFPFAPNKNLIETRNGIAYEYQFNSKGQVTYMFAPYSVDSVNASEGDYTHYKFNFTYYE